MKLTIVLALGIILVQLSGCAIQNHSAMAYHKVSHGSQDFKKLKQQYNLQNPDKTVSADDTNIYIYFNDQDIYSGYDLFGIPLKYSTTNGGKYYYESPNENIKEYSIVQYTEAYRWGCLPFISEHGDACYANKTIHCNGFLCDRTIELPF